MFRCQRPLVKGLGLGVLALGVAEPRQVVEAVGHVGVFRAQCLFQNRQRPPLALDQAGSYIEETGCGLGGYLDLYRHHAPLHSIDTWLSTRGAGAAV